MLQERRLQWKIAWSDYSILFIVVLIISEVVRGKIFGPNMGVQVHQRYERKYIPFEKVLKKNFLLQEEVEVLNQQLSSALNSLSILENRTNYLILTKEQEVSQLQNEVKTLYDKAVLIEGLVKTMAEEKRKLTVKCQENVKLAIRVKESEDKIKELQEELKQQNLSKSMSDNKSVEIMRLKNVPHISSTPICQLRARECGNINSIDGNRPCIRLVDTSNQIQ